MDAFYKYPSLPIVESETVVLQAIARGVQEGLFAVQIGEQVYYKKPVSLSEASMGQTVRTDYTPPAAEPSEQTASTTGGATPTPSHVTENGGKVLPPPPVPRPRLDAAPSYRRYALRARFSSDKFSEVFSSVIKPSSTSRGAVSPSR
jgi:hypothetical protein